VKDGKERVSRDFAHNLTLRILIKYRTEWKSRNAYSRISTSTYDDRLRSTLELFPYQSAKCALISYLPRRRNTVAPFFR